MTLYWLVFSTLQEIPLTYVMVMKAVWPTWLVLVPHDFQCPPQVALGTPITRHIGYSSNLALIRTSRQCLRYSTLNPFSGPLLEASGLLLLVVEGFSICCAQLPKGSLLLTTRGEFKNLSLIMLVLARLGEFPILIFSLLLLPTSACPSLLLALYLLP